MSDTKHTPGPWFVFPHTYRDEGPGSFSIGTNANKDLADILCSRFQWPERASEMEANARLIAAAPSMYSYIEARADAGDDAAQSILEAVHARR